MRAMNLTFAMAAMTAATMTACGDNGGSSASDTGASTGTATMTAPTTTGETTPTTGTASATDSSSAGTMGASESNGTVPTTGDTTAADPTTTTATTTATTGSTGDSSTGPVSASDTGSGDSTTGNVPCGEPGEPEFSYIWIANSSQGTVSKIDTQTMQEVGRYLVHPNGGVGNPSRTSVSISGDVAVANRSGGLTKVHAREVDCVESNGMPGIQTAKDANFLAWDVEECRAWYTPMIYESQRPVAWTPGTFNENNCTYENQKVWTAGASEQVEQGVTIHRVDGATGAIEDTVKIPEVVPQYFGIYGAAVDEKGSFWGSQLGVGRLVYVDGETLQYKTWPMSGSGYGMTVGKSGYVWTCSSEASRFDPMTETWQVANVGGSGGCMEDDNGTLYMSGAGNSIIALDVETMQVKKTLPVPNYVHGISIDFYGFVWGVTLFQPFAYRVDPNDGTFQTFTGLVDPYTYSDMTGVALSNVAPQ